VLAETMARTGGGVPDPQALPTAELALEAAAVRALLANYGDVPSALRSIAPNVSALPAAEQRRIAGRIFSDDLLAPLRAAIDRERTALISATVRIALDRTNRPLALRAIDVLCKIAGWYAPTPARRAAGQQAVRNPPGLSLTGALALMQHEPGAPVAMPDEP
jgi:hypothetical protein